MILDERQRKILDRRNTNTILCKHETNTNIVLWKKLQVCFPLPPSSFKYHKCDWYRIEPHIFGCKLCGHIHQCCPETCKPYITIDDDFEVCTISGICLRTSQGSHAQEFHDQILYWPDPQPIEFAAPFDMVQIEKHVQELLLSDVTHELWQFRMKKMHATICKQIELDFVASKSFIDQFEKLLSDTVRKQNLCFAYNHAMRIDVSKTCCEQILHTLSLCSKQFKLGTKQNDIRNTVFGLMYLMREGVTFANVSVVPKIDALRYLLPSESALFKSFNFKPKFITDIENRCKYAFRTGQVSRRHIQNLTEQK